MREKEEFVVGGSDYLDNLEKKLIGLKAEKQRLEQEGKEVPPGLEEEIKNLDEDIENKMKEAIEQVEEISKGDAWKTPEEMSEEERRQMKDALKKSLEGEK